MWVETYNLFILILHPLQVDSLSQIVIPVCRV